MNGANGDALEWALALLRAPGERHALRQKPLPDRVDRLLGVAAGVLPKERAEAARAFNESEARICEAARFYAREILFFPQAEWIVDAIHERILPLPGHVPGANYTDGELIRRTRLGV